MQNRVIGAKIVSNVVLARLSQRHRQNYNNIMRGGEKEGEGDVRGKYEGDTMQWDDVGVSE